MPQLIRYLVNNIFHKLQKQHQTIFLCYCLLLSPLLLSGQAYPVDCRILLSPPYSGNWTDYANSPTKFRVQLLLRDLTKPSLEVSLRIRLKSVAGVWIENPEGFITSNPITLSPGVPRIISGVELFDNFNPNNLEAQGIDLKALYQGEVLPVGPYQWEVLAIELYRNRQVSNIGSARMTINANYAPLLNLPRNEAVLMPSQPQNILFSWTPRHTASPSLGVKYTLFLYEISDDDNIQAVVNSGISPYRIIESSQPNYLYGATEVPLQAGKRYAWQVKVEDLQGKEAFQNDGYSNIQSFSYGKPPCLAPENLMSEIETEDDKPTGAVRFSWKDVQDAKPIAYILTYNQEGSLPTEVRTTKPEHLLLQQEAGKNYEWKVQSVCGVGDKSSFTSIETFNIPSPEPESWYSDPNLSYQEEPTPKADPDVMRTKEDEVENNETTSKEIENVNALLNTPIQIFIPAEGEENLPEGIPASLPILPQNATVEQLQAALKTKKPTCSGIVCSYSCGNHDTTPTYNGTIIQVNTGDEVAMNSLVLSIVSIDGSGNGSGLIKIPMMNNVKLGVTLSGIQVAEGGCVVAGRAELSGISASVLTEQQRVNLEKAYTTFNQIIDAGIVNAGAIAETYNDIAELYNGMAKKTQAMLDKLNNGEKISQRDAKALEEMKKQATVATDKMIEALKTKFGSEGSEEFIAFLKSTTESCVCSADIEKPKKGPNAEFYFSFDDDCKKCLEEQKKKQEQAAQVIKKVQKILIVKMQCGCFKLGNFLQDFGHFNKKCEEVINKVEMVKNAIKTGKSLPTTDLSIQGQILIGSVCYTDLQVISIQGSLDPKKFEINSDGITFKNVLKFNITEPDDRKMKVELLRKYLFEEVKEVEEEKSEGDKKVEILDDEAYKKYAKIAGVNDFLAFKAFALVESGGNGFFEYKGQEIPKMLFERQEFYRCIKNGKFSSKGKVFESVVTSPKDKLSELEENFPEVVKNLDYVYCSSCKNLPARKDKCEDKNSYVLRGKDCCVEDNKHDYKWFISTCYPSSQVEVYEKQFLVAKNINKECAFMSTSWGLGQVMGYNFRDSYKNIDEMENEIMKGGSMSQISIMANFIKSDKDLQNAINKEDWATAASIYNGPTYYVHGYDKTIKEKYENLKK
ncbi:N-acetylmuramidase domain-containing protein [Emticicia sp. SJ17W-69]|uniref:N-acetylmuramidase domain-containing protein n=1 Tax=Emticicia sp. SJ17W-69 TaxID=3421657 RepID=UPI003EBF2435